MRTSQRDLSAEWRCRTKASCAGREQEPLGGDPQWDPQWDPCSAQDPFQTHVKIKIAGTVSFKDEILCDQVLKLGLAFGVRNSRIPKPFSKVSPVGRPHCWNVHPGPEVGWGWESCLRGRGART